ncbi:hypothetical protein P8452_60469 [Trifolium repens]|nr:hypothetical protein P8452_60469 [Trifolium repens]
MVSDPVVEDVSVEAECKRCKELGHNTRSCKGKRAAERSIPKGGNKKQKVNKQYPAAADTQVKVKPKKKAKNDQGQTVINQGSQAPPQTQDSQA